MTEFSVFIIFFVYFNVTKYTVATIHNWFAGEFLLQCLIVLVGTWVQILFNLPMYERFYHYLKQKSGLFSSSYVGDNDNVTLSDPSGPQTQNADTTSQPQTVPTDSQQDDE